jgi:hypothetical protein
MFLSIFLAVALIFLAYALIAHYRATNPIDSVPKRVLAAVIAAATSIAAAIGAWIANGSGTSP